MADRGSHRGGGGRGGGNFRGRGGGAGRGGGGGRGGHGGHHHGSNQHGGEGGSGESRPKKENILDLSKYNDKQITVKFNGGREGAFESPPPPGKASQGPSPTRPRSLSGPQLVSHRGNGVPNADQERV